MDGSLPPFYYDEIQTKQTFYLVMSTYSPSMISLHEFLSMTLQSQQFFLGNNSSTSLQATGISQFLLFPTLLDTLFFWALCSLVWRVFIVLFRFFFLGVSTIVCMDSPWAHDDVDGRASHSCVGRPLHVMEWRSLVIIVKFVCDRPNTHSYINR